MGAELIYEQRYINKEQENSTTSKREECVKLSAHASLGGGGFGYYAKVTDQSDAEKCRNTVDENNKKQSESEDIQRTITRGSRPLSFQQWVNSDFTPVPLRKELLKISSLFRNEWLTNNTLYGMSRDLDGDSMKLLFESRINRYCELLMKGILNPDCTISKYSI